MLPLPAAVAWVVTCSVPDVSWGRIGTGGAGVSVRHIVAMQPAIIPVVKVFGVVGVWGIYLLASIKTL
jgi:hypothetical protein